MSSFDNVGKLADRAPIVTLAGNVGTGKTTLAATWPKPIFICVEQGMASIPYAKRPDAFPPITKSSQLGPILRDMENETHGYETLVIDSGSALDRLFADEICASDPKKPASINQALGGYGNGVAAVGKKQGKLFAACERMSEKGINIVFICHSDTIVVDLPDQAEFMRYSLRMGKKSLPYYLDEPDLVGFMRLATSVIESESEHKAGKAVSTGEIEICCSTAASSEAKNRYGIKHALPVIEGVNPFVGLIPGLTQDKK